MPPKAQPLHERYVVDETTGCWNFTGICTKQGYGHVSTNRRGKVITRKAHRLMYEQCVGPIPEGLTIDHLCRNPRCINPAHLEPVTATENTRRSPTTKLSKLKATELRLLYRTGCFSQLELAKAFGVSERNVNLVVKGKSWIADFAGNHQLTLNAKQGRRSRLSEKQISELVMRYRNGETQKSLAEDFGVSVPTVSRLVNLKKDICHEHGYESPVNGIGTSATEAQLGSGSQSDD